MSAEDRGAGPQIGQTVLYNNAGTIVAGIIYGIGTSGSANIIHFAAGAANNVTNVPYGGVTFPASTWTYPQFL